jgi:hypothetical protein
MLVTNNCIRCGKKCYGFYYKGIKRPEWRIPKKLCLGCYWKNPNWQPSVSQENINEVKQQ